LHFLIFRELFAKANEDKSGDQLAEYLLRPDLGRCFSESSQAELIQRIPRANDSQIAIGDGLRDAMRRFGSLTSQPE